jgi:hypothetical protein
VSLVIHGNGLRADQCSLVLSGALTEAHYGLGLCVQLLKKGISHEIMTDS